MENGQLSALDAAVAGPVPEECFVTLEDVEQYWDDVNGGFLPPDRVREARQLELAYLRKQEVYEKVPLEESLRDTNGRGPIYPLDRHQQRRSHQPKLSVKIGGLGNQGPEET